MTDRVLQAVSASDSMSGPDDVLSLDLTGYPSAAFIDLGSTNQYFKAAIPGITEFPNNFGMRFYMLYEDADNHVRFEATTHDHVSYAQNQIDIYIVKGGVERGPLGGGIFTGGSGLITLYASADSDYIGIDGHAFFFGFGGGGAYINSLDGGGFFGNGNADPDLEDLPHGTLMGWDLTDFYDYWNANGRSYGDPTLQPWSVLDENGTPDVGYPIAKSLTPTPLPAEWIPVINDPWPSTMSIWSHRDNAVRRVHLSYNPGSSEPFNFVRDGALIRDLHAPTGRIGVRSRTDRIIVGWQGWLDARSDSTTFSYQQANNGGTYPIGSFGSVSATPYAADALVEIDAYWDRQLTGGSGLRAALDFYIERYYGGDYRQFYDERFQTDAEFVDLVLSNRRFHLVFDIYIDGQKIRPPYSFINPDDPSGSANINDPTDVGTFMSLSAGSGDIETDDDIHYDSFWGGPSPQYYDFSYAPYLYGPFAYMIVTDVLDYVSWEAHAIFDGHYSGLASPLLESSNVVRYRFESNKTVILADGTTTTIQDGTNPIAEWRLKPANGFGPNEHWLVTLTVWNADGLSDSVTADVPVGPGRPMDMTAADDRDGVQFYPYGPRPVA